RDAEPVRQAGLGQAFAGTELARQDHLAQARHERRIGHAGLVARASGLSRATLRPEAVWDTKMRYNGAVELKFALIVSRIRSRLTPSIVRRRVWPGRWRTSCRRMAAR